VVTRREFLAAVGATGLSAAALTACANEDTVGEDVGGASFAGRVLIVGAGAAGISAGHALAQHGVEFTIVEAASTYGGRMKHITDFVDFPIPLGAEWLHEAEGELARMVNDADVDVKVEIAAYDASAVTGFYDGTYQVSSTEDNDLKFVGSSWMDFFETYLVPSVADRMEFGVEITEIDYSDEQIRALARSGSEYVVDRVIVTVPISALQQGRVRFRPELPTLKQRALSAAQVWMGFQGVLHVHRGVLSDVCRVSR